MTRIAIIGDSHFDETSRFDECIRVHDWIVEDVERRGVDLVLHGGDIFERKSTPRERNAVAAFLIDLAEYCPVVVVRGNHDVVNDLRIFGQLEVPNAIIIEEAAALHVVQARDGTYVYVPAVSWPRKAELLARAAEEGLEPTEQLAADCLRNVLRGLGDQMERGDAQAPRILLMHAMVRGSETSLGQPLVGCDMELGLEDLALARADLYALGHIHMPQDWTIAGAPVVYPGSPRRTAFGEVEEKGYIVAEFDGRRLVGWERVPTPCADMVLLEARYVGDENGAFELTRGMLTDAEHEGAEVRFRYEVASDRRDEARAAAEGCKRELLGFGAAYVKLEEQVISETRARAPEVAKAVTLEEKLSAFWTVKSFDPGERRERLLAKAHAVEDEVRNAS